MSHLLLVFASLSILSVAIPLRKAAVKLAATTLAESIGWSVAAVTAWAVATIAETAGIARDGVTDQLWYAAIVLTLAPFISVLGARRPASRVWSWFIVLPMTIVLFLPAVTAWSSDWRPHPLRLEAPMLLGYGLVLLMGVGNFAASRFRIPALLAGAACLTIAISLLTFDRLRPQDPAELRALATIAISVAAWIAALQLRRSPAEGATRFDRAWVDFQDLFGIVWTRRIQDRLNAESTYGHWLVRFDRSGPVPSEPGSPVMIADETDRQIDHAFRWLLRRFVDESWLAERLGPARPPAE